MNSVTLIPAAWLNSRLLKERKEEQVIEKWIA
jgi:hypothetical protein